MAGSRPGGADEEGAEGGGGSGGEEDEGRAVAEMNAEIWRMEN